MRHIDQLLDRLDGVKGGNGVYRAFCPAHQGKNLTLAIKEREDGKTMVTCYKGCTAGEIMASVGLSTKDLYPESNLTNRERIEYAQKKSKADIESAILHELYVLLSFVSTRVASRELAKNSNFRVLCPEWQPVPDGHWERETLSVKRIKNGLARLYEN